MKSFISYGNFQCTELAPHKNMGMEITYIEKGLMEWMVQGRTEKVEAGSVFFTLPWQVHGSLYSKEPENKIWHVLFHLDKDYPTPQPHFRFADELGFTDEETMILSTAFSSRIRHCFRATSTLRHLMQTLISELQSTHELREVLANTLLRAVLVELKRIVTLEVSDIETYTRSEQRVRALATMMSSDCGQNWTLSKMADHCGVRRTQLCKIFQKLTSSTPIEYLLRIRIVRAKMLLRSSDIKVIDIAFECGYSSSQYFANSFRHATGMTPSEYRENGVKLSAAESMDWEDIKFRSEKEELRRVRKFSKV